MSTLYVDLQLKKKHRIKLTIMDMAEVYDRLNASPSRKVEVDGIQILKLLAGMEWTAWGTILWAAMRHENPDVKSPDKARQMLSDYLADGGDLVPVGEAVRLAMFKSGALSKDLYYALTPTARRDDDEGGRDERSDPPQSME